MKRRQILGAIGTVALPLSSKASSLYGTPVSVSGPLQHTTEPLRVMLDTLSLPQETMPLILRFGNVWERVLGNEKDKQRFRYDPAGFLEENGIPKSILDSRDQEIVLLKALTDDTLLSIALSGDYKEFITRLIELGLTSNSGRSNLKKGILQAVRNGAESIKQKQYTKESAMEAAKPYANKSELVYLYGQLSPSIEQVAVAAVPVAIAAIVVVYISVAASVTVGILAGVYVSVAVATAITVGELCNCIDPTDGLNFAGPASSSSMSRTERQRNTHAAIIQRELVAKRMLALSPEYLREAQKQAKIARLLHNNDFVLEVNRQLIRDEVQYFVEAAEECGLITIPATTRKDVIGAMQSIALRASELA